MYDLIGLGPQLRMSQVDCFPFTTQISGHFPRDQNSWNVVANGWSMCDWKMGVTLSSVRNVQITRRGVWGARGGLASHGLGPEYSPALAWVTTGFGMGPGGSTSLSATSPPDAPGGTGVAWDHAQERSQVRRGIASLGGTRPGAGDVRAVLGHEHGSAPVGYPPSTCRLATRSSAGGLTR